MAKKEFLFKGKTIDELKALSIKEFSLLISSRERRTLKRGFTDAQKILLKKIRSNKKNIETHCRDMIILPEMNGLSIKIHKGNGFEMVMIQPKMIGHRLGEFAQTRKKVSHSAPGIGATRSSASVSVK